MPAPELALRGDLPAPDWAELQRVARELGAHPVAVDLLRRRGLGEPAEQVRYLNPRLQDLRPPTDMAGFTEALELVGHQLRPGEHIVVVTGSNVLADADNLVVVHEIGVGDC